MIVDMRIYTTHYNKTSDFVALYKEAAWPLQEKYLGRCLGWFITAEGQLNQCVHLWGYESQADREKRRSAMIADPGWGVYLKKLFELNAFVAQENRILRPTEFSPVQ
jgi:hypothetical protein